MFDALVNFFIRENSNCVIVYILIDALVAVVALVWLVCSVCICGYCAAGLFFGLTGFYNRPYNTLSTNSSTKIVMSSNFIVYLR